MPLRPSVSLLLLLSGMLLAITVLAASRLAWHWSVLLPLLGALACFGAGLAGLRLAGQRLRTAAGRVEEMARGQHKAAGLEVSHGELGRLTAAVNDLAHNLGAQMDVANKERGQLLAILSSMVEGVIAVDHGDRILHLNESAAAMLQLPYGSLTGQRYWEAIRNPQVLQSLQETLRTGEPGTAEVLVAGRQRDQVIELAAAPLRDSSGHIAGAVAVLHEVTELRRLQGIRKDFVANVSHELKTPVAAISGLVETLLEDADMEAAQAEYFLQRIQVQNDRMIALVRDLLTLSRIESDGHELTLERIDVRSVVADSVRTLASTAERGGVTLTSDLPDSPIPLLSNAEALRQIADNLIDNAIKYTPAGGRVEVALSVGTGGIVYRVTDSGVGIAEEEQERIFERFYRIDKARSREVGGTGLGLSIVKHLARALGGEISVSSRLGHGSTFALSLPLSGGPGL